MSRVAIVGLGPLPFQPSRRHAAAGLRAWQFASALHSAGHEVDLLLFSDDSAGALPALPAGISARLLPSGGREERSARTLRALIGEPVALFGASTYPSFLAARSGHPAPLWIDLHGDPLAEAQARTASESVGAAAFDAHWLVSWCLRRGDRFSAVSRAQRHALLGQLGLVGRLSAASVGLPLVAVVPDAFDEVCQPGDPIQSERFVVHFAGSFNSWIDGETLVNAIRIAFAAEPAMDLLVSGGEIAGFLEEPWRKFSLAMAELPEELKSRVSLRGWIPSHELERLEQGVACGVVPERPWVERELGSQNRTLRWMARGIPVVTTALSELGAAIESRELGLVYPPGDAGALAAALLRLARDRELGRRLGGNARAWLRAERSIAATTAPLVEWAADPRPAPDRLRGEIDSVTRRLAQIPLDQLHLESRGGDDPTEE